MNRHKLPGLGAAHAGHSSLFDRNLRQRLTFHWGWISIIICQSLLTRRLNRRTACHCNRSGRLPRLMQWQTRFSERISWTVCTPSGDNSPLSLRSQWIHVRLSTLLLSQRSSRPYCGLGSFYFSITSSGKWLPFSIFLEAAETHSIMTDTEDLRSARIHPLRAGRDIMDRWIYYGNSQQQQQQKSLQMQGQYVKKNLPNQELDPGCNYFT